MDIAEPSVMLKNMGAILSIINDLVALIELVSPGTDRVRSAELPAASKIVPPLKVVVPVTVNAPPTKTLPAISTSLLASRTPVTVVIPVISAPPPTNRFLYRQAPP